MEVAMAAEGRSERFLKRRQNRIERRRQEILAAAARIFAEKGYAATTTREVAAAADLAEGTLYNYFANKRELLLAVASEAEAPMEAAAMAASQIRDRAGLVTVVEQALDLPAPRLAFMRTMLAEAWVDDHILEEFAVIRLGRIHRRLTAFITERVADGTFRQIDPALTAQLVIGMFGAVLLPTLRGATPPPDADQRRILAESIVGLLLDGILTRGS